MRQEVPVWVAVLVVLVVLAGVGLVYWLMAKPQPTSPYLLTGRGAAVATAHPLITHRFLHNYLASASG